MRWAPQCKPYKSTRSQEPHGTSTEVSLWLIVAFLDCMPRWLVTCHALIHINRAASCVTQRRYQHSDSFSSKKSQSTMRYVYVGVRLFQFRVNLHLNVLTYTPSSSRVPGSSQRRYLRRWCHFTFLLWTRIFPIFFSAELPTMFDGILPPAEPQIVKFLLPLHIAAD